MSSPRHVGLVSVEGDDQGGGVPVADASLWIPQSSSRAKQAAWELVKFLSAPEQQAAFVVGSWGGHVPTRRAALDDPELQALWAAQPDLRVPYDQLAAGPEDAAIERYNDRVAG